MKREDFIATLQKRTGVASVGPSALRGQGSGVLKASQQFLGQIDLSGIPKSAPQDYRQWLDHQTKLLLKNLPVNGNPWGTARKALNLFMRDALYNRYLNHHYRISAVESWLEIPLDSAVARGLKRRAGRGKLPIWQGLKKLKPEASDKFQDFAQEYSRAQGMKRVHLDIYLWVENR